ncbi:hypothetical protein [Corynebacterium hesseae]|uniref:hypothetical protein n=1 Tax=Corynebacterium hesseae TaxID=2913502 RepID=UPI0022B9E756|nr:hypothetical protein [Corynebacterium hesseae]MCZ9299455.1 hypothetical protein [Corynebacterium hesseae]
MKRKSDIRPTKGSRQTPVEILPQEDRSESGKNWIPILMVGSISLLSFGPVLLKRQASIEAETPCGTVEGNLQSIPLKGRVKAYWMINIILAVFYIAISALAGWNLATNPMCKEDVWTNAGVIALSLINTLICFTRFSWIKTVNNRGFQVTSNPDDYALERVGLLAFILLLIIPIIVEMIEGASGIGAIQGWAAVLALWTPIVSVIGSSWGKLKATKPNGDKAVWPLHWGES